MSKKISLGAAIALALLLVAASIPLTMRFAQDMQNKIIVDLPRRMKEFQAVEEVREKVDANFFKLPNEESVTVEMVRGYLAGLGDPDSRYLNAEEAMAYSKRLLGEQPDLGVELEYNPNPDGLPNVTAEDLSKRNGIVISHVKFGSPAAGCGLAVGDHIVKIETAEGKPLFQQSDVNAENYNEWIRKLGNISALTVESSSATLTITYKRGGERMPPVSVILGNSISTVSSQLLESWHKDGEVGGDMSVGYIKIYYFFQNTREQLESAIKELANAGATYFIFDLRGCTEGTIPYACNALNLLLPVMQESPIATIHYRDKQRESPSFISDSTSYLSYATGRVAVLINSATSGPAELFAYNLQAFATDKVLLVGQPTAGKNTVQELLTLSQVGGAALLTTGTVNALFDTADWNKGGVKPGYWAKNTAVGNDTHVFVSLLKTSEGAVSLNVGAEALQLQSAINALTQPPPNETTTHGR
ncbi:MAG: hypothetical protein LBB50_01800 [Oscillospiraceae bacterium]|nr:hypothetical protein [Oscillospiraceae bacterium]